MGAISIFDFVILLAIYHTTYGIHLGGNSCRVQHGFQGICRSWRSCPGASRNDKGNSYDCVRWHTCCVPDEFRNPEESTEHFNRDYWSNKRKKQMRRSGADQPTPEIQPPSPPEQPPEPPAIPNLRVRGCGVRNTLRDFIVGGQEAEYWPWMAAIFHRPRGESVFKCGGTVISKRYVLTAAHCLIARRSIMPLASVTVRVGGLTTQGNGYVHQVTDIRIPRGYDPQLHYDDIALVRLAEDIQSKNVVPACLPSPGMFNANFFNRTGTVTGWGDTEYGTVSLNNRLREVKIPIVPNSRCARRYSRLSALSLPRGIVDTQICAGATNGSLDACQGDSGGPLLLEDRSNKWNIIGIVSFGFGCADPEYPGVYTRVAKYLPWIQRNTDIPSRNS